MTGLIARMQNGFLASPRLQFCKRFVMATAFALTVSACATQNMPVEPEALQNPNGSLAEGYGAAEPVQFWWEVVDDQALSALITEAHANNPNLAAALERVRAARAMLRESRTGRRPAVDFAAISAYQRPSEAAAGFPEFQARSEAFASSDLSSAWELDVFGRIDSVIAGAQANAQAEQAALDDLHRVIAAEMARAFVDYQTAIQRNRVAQQALVSQRRTLELTRALSNAGRASRLDVERAEAQVASTEATLPRFEQALGLASNRIDTLIGAPAGAGRAAAYVADAPITLPEIDHVGTLGGLIRRRPDVRAAELRIAGFVAEAGVARADLYPRISLAGTAGFSALERGRGDAFGFSVGPQLQWSVFDRDAVYARIEQADARAHEAIALHRAVVLQALEELQGALLSYEQEAARANALARASEAAQQAAFLSQIRYEAGGEPLLTVLDAERVALAAQDALVVSQAARKRAKLNVYNALAGGWSSDEGRADAEARLSASLEER